MVAELWLIECECFLLQIRANPLRSDLTVSDSRSQFPRDYKTVLTTL